MIHCRHFQNAKLFLWVTATERAKYIYTNVTGTFVLMSRFNAFEF